MYSLKLSEIVDSCLSNNYPSTFQLYTNIQQYAVNLNHFRIYSFILRYNKKALVFLLCPFSFHLISKFNQIENAVSLRNLDENTQVQHFSHRSSHFTREYSPGELRVQLHHLSCHNVQWLNFPTVSTLDIQHYFAFLFLRSACLSANWKKARTGSEKQPSYSK